MSVSAMAAPAGEPAIQPTVDIGTTVNFAVLAGTTITSAGTTTIGGSFGSNVGLDPNTSITGDIELEDGGVFHIADEVAQKAKDDLVTAYNDAAGRTPETEIASELGGKTLKPGVYVSESGTFQITGTLTLDAEGNEDGVFVFKTKSSLVTASDSKVILEDSARFCRTFWQVGSSATLGTNSVFAGHIFALTSISALTGAKIQGQLLARNGEVTLDSNTIINGPCDTTSGEGDASSADGESSSSSSTGGSSSSTGGGGHTGGGGNVGGDVSSSNSAASSSDTSSISSELSSSIENANSSVSSTGIKNLSSRNTVEGSFSGSVSQVENKNPKTGDNSMYMAIFLSVLAVISLIIVIVLNRKAIN